MISSIQTAVVTGPSGEEIHVDEHGRIRVQLHWDRQGSNDERSMCWVRVQQPWAGAGWGFWWVPRIGMEVVVQLVDGDLDRPLVTGCVYNAANPLPYSLPAEKTKSTMKSNSSLGGGGFNEFRFEDLAGSEEIYTHAQKDYNEVVENDHTTLVHHDQTNTVDNDQTQTIGGNQTETVHGNQALTVDASRTVHVKGSFDEKRSIRPFVFSANGKFYLTYVGFDGTGYQTGICESRDLVNWKRLGMIMARDPSDPVTRHNIACASILRENDLRSPARLVKVDGQYVAAWHAYPSPGYEEGPAVIGLAFSKDFMKWERGPASCAPRTARNGSVAGSTSRT